MYRHSPIRNPRSKGIKFKNVLQVCLLVAVCFWLIFQVKRSHDKKKEFDNTKISLNTIKQTNDEIAKLGRKDLQPKLEKEVELHEEHEEQDEEHEEVQEEEKIDDEKDDGGGGGDDEIDENEQEKSDVEVDHEESEVIDEENEEKDVEIQTENGVSVDDHEEDDGASTHTHEGREEHYKADDASSAVVTHIGSENGTLDNNSNEEILNSETVNNGTSILDSNETQNVTEEHALDFAPNETEGSSNSSYVSEVLNSNESNDSDGLKTEVERDENEGENLEGKEEILDPDEVENESNLEEKEVRMDLDTLPEIETEGGNNEDSAVERR